MLLCSANTERLKTFLWVIALKHLWRATMEGSCNTLFWDWVIFLSWAAGRIWEKPVLETSIISLLEVLITFLQPIKINKSCRFTQMCVAPHACKNRRAHLGCSEAIILGQIRKLSEWVKAEKDFLPKKGEGDKIMMMMDQVRSVSKKQWMNELLCAFQLSHICIGAGAHVWGTWEVHEVHEVTRWEGIQLKGCVFSRPAPARGMQARKRNLSIGSIPVCLHVKYMCEIQQSPKLSCRRLSDSFASTSLPRHFSPEELEAWDSRNLEEALGHLCGV